MSARTVATPAEALDKRDLLKVLSAFRKGDFSVRLSFEGTGVDAKIADALNEVIELNEKMCREFGRISNAVGKQGRIDQRADIGKHGGDWASSVESINTLIVDVVQPSTEDCTTSTIRV